MPRLDNETDFEYKKRVLDKLSPSFCGAKWYNATIWLGSGRTTSCHHPPAHFISVESVKANYKALHNTPEKKEDRRKMQLGERPTGCEYCWKIEDMGSDVASDRPDKSARYSDEDLSIAKNLDYNEDINLQTLEIAFDRTCQFACSYCNPAFSTTWVKDIKKSGPYINLVTDGRGHFTHVHSNDQLYDYNEDNPYVDAFFQWWESDLHRTLSELRITGGEPLMSGHTWKLFEWFEKNKQKSQTKLAINSNLGFEKSLLIKMLDATEYTSLTIYSSNESVGSQAEYIRDGLDWNQWKENMEFLLESKRLDSLNVMCTINALCLDSLCQFLDLIVQWKRKYTPSAIMFSLNIMRFPSFQGCLVLPSSLRTYYKEQLLNWYNNNIHHLHNFEKNHVERLIDYLDKVNIPHGEGFDRNMAERDFKNFYQQYDLRRNKNLSETFSQRLVDWYTQL
jgi:organic radical activating enzyme